MGFMSNSFELSFDDLEYDIQVFGLVSHLKDYRIAHFLNKTLEINLARYTELNKHSEENTKTEEEDKFSKYSFVDTEHETFINLISNKSQGDLLFKKKKEFDFFLVFSLQYSKKQREIWSEKLKAMPQLIIVKEISPDEINAAELLFTS